MSIRSRGTTILLACMVAFSVVAAAGPLTIAQEDPTETIQTLENGEALYLSFGADLDGMNLEEYIERHADGSGDAQVIQYQDVEQVNVHEEGEAVSVSIGGGEATAIQDVTQRNANSQQGEATAESGPGDSHRTTFENVDEVYVIVGDGPDRSYDGWGVGEDGDVDVTQEAQAIVAQAQAVSQANVVQNATAFALAEADSEANAIQLTQQSNRNLQEGSANATNVLAADLDDHDDRAAARKKGQSAHKKGSPSGPTATQDADAVVAQDQTVTQINENVAGAAVAIAVGEGATATAAQVTDQSNLNEQVGSADALNALVDSAGMNVAMAATGTTTDVVTQDAMNEKDPKKKGDGSGVQQTADASVTQYQSAEQINLDMNSSAIAIASDGSTAEAVQITVQENINAQIASADALNVFVEDDELTEKQAKKLEADGHEYDGLVVTNTTTAAIGGVPLADADRTTFDYAGDDDQLNAVEQWSTAEIEQRQEVGQANYHSSEALAVAEDGDDASAVQLTIQENENLQFAAVESTAVEDGPIGGDEKKDADGTKDRKDDGGSVETAETDDGPDKRKSDDGDEMPGFGVAVAVIAVAAAALLARRR